MTRAEYMRQLENLLKGVPDAEKEEALQYYNDYFDDASDKEDDDIIKSLGSPEELAESIKAGLTDDGNQGMFTEEGFVARESKREELGSFTGMDTFFGYSNSGKSGHEESDTTKIKEIPEEDKNKSNNNFWLIVILGIMAAPIILSILGTVFGIVTGIIGGIIGLVCGFIGLVIGLVVASVSLLIVGVLAISQTGLLSGLCLIGAGLICTAASIFSIWLCGLMLNLAKKAIPYVWNAFKWVWDKVFGFFKKKEVA